MSWRGPTEGDGTESTRTKALGLELVVLTAGAAGRSIPVLPGHFTLGSDPRCDIVLALPGVEPAHVQGNHGEDGSFWVKGTQPGTTFINGMPISNWEQLTAGSFLKVGEVEMVLRERGKGSSPYGTLRAPTPLRSPPHPGRTSGAHPLTGPAAPVPLDSTHVRPSGSHSQGGSPRPLTLNAPVAEHLEPGAVIADRYRIITKLAAGGMGEVYKAEHIELSRVFALKVMRPELSNDPEFVERFKREAVASGRIGQQNIVDITDFGRTADGRFYFVMEFLDGRTLASIVGHEGAQPYARVLHLALQMCRALGAAHKLGIVHRDLKPENVMVLQRDGQTDLVKVVDFGVAKVSTGHGAGGQTAIGMVVGTPQYMAPEQAAGLGVDTRSDIYSLGLIFYELLTGRPAFKGETPSILMSLQMTAAPAPLAPGPLSLPVPLSLEQLVFRMLAKKAAERPQSTDEVLRVLEELSRQSTASASGRLPQSTSMPAFVAPPSGLVAAPPPPSQVQPAPSGLQQVAPKSKTPLIAAAVVGLAVLGGAGVLALKSGGTADPVVVPLPPAPAPTKVEPTPVVKDVPRAAGNVKVVLVTLPEKAAVYEGTVYVGTTPLTMTRDEGATVELRFLAKGFKEETRAVRFGADSPTIEISLQKEKPATKGGKKKKNELQDDPYAQEDDLKDLPDP